MATTYHNTTHENGALLLDFTQKALSQDELILTFAKKAIFFSPSHLHAYLIKNGLIDSHTPLTSIRRAITNLTEQNRLIKTENKVKSVYDRPENVWCYKA